MQKYNSIYRNYEPSVVLEKILVKPKTLSENLATLSELGRCTPSQLHYLSRHPQRFFPNVKVHSQQGSTLPHRSAHLPSERILLPATHAGYVAGEQENGQGYGEVQSKAEGQKSVWVRPAAHYRGTVKACFVIFVSHYSRRYENSTNLIALSAL